MGWSNLGSAVLVIGAGYLHYVYHMNEWISIGLALFGLITWAYPGFTKERQKITEAQLELIRAKTEFYRHRGDKVCK